MEEHRVCAHPRVPEVHGSGLISHAMENHLLKQPYCSRHLPSGVADHQQRLSEALDRVDERLFPTLMGATKEEVEVLLGDFRKLRDDLPS